MKLLAVILLICHTAAAQAPGASPYLEKVLKYNEKSVFEDVRYKTMDWKSFYKLEEANDLISAENYDFDLLNAAIFFATNKYRESRHIPPLIFEPRLRDAATIHTDQMVTKNFFDHINTSDANIASPDRRIELSGYKGRKLAENLDRGYMNPGQPLTYIQIADKAVLELSHSRDHNKHLIDPDLQKLGCAALFERTATKGYIYFRLTQDFGTDWK